MIMAKSNSDKTEKAIETFNSIDINLKKGSFSWLDLFINSFSITLFTKIRLNVPFLRKELKSF